MNIEDKAYFGKELTSDNIGDTVSVAKQDGSFNGQVKITKIQGSFCQGVMLTGNRKGYLVEFTQGEIVD